MRILALAILTIASVFDLRARRIPNALIAVAVPASLAGIYLEQGVGGLWGALLAGACYGVGFGIAGALGYLGFGDVKLIAVLAFCLGGNSTLYAIVYGFLLAAMWMIAWLTWKGDLGRLGKWRRPRDPALAEAGHPGHRPAAVATISFARHAHSRSSGPDLSFGGKRCGTSAGLRNVGPSRSSS